jgi:hypothetical protein
MGLVFFFFPYILLRAFTNDPDVIQYGILYMKIVAFAQVPLAITMVVGGALRGAGDTGFIMFGTMPAWSDCRLQRCCGIVRLRSLRVVGHDLRLAYPDVAFALALSKMSWGRLKCRRGSGDRQKAED